MFNKVSRLQVYTHYDISQYFKNWILTFSWTHISMNRHTHALDMGTLMWYLNAYATYYTHTQIYIHGGVNAKGFYLLHYSIALVYVFLKSGVVMIILITTSTVIMLSTTNTIAAHVPVVTASDISITSIVRRHLG